MPEDTTHRPLTGWPLTAACLLGGMMAVAWGLWSHSTGRDPLWWAPVLAGAFAIGSGLRAMVQR